MNTAATDWNTLIFLGAGTKTLSAAASTTALTVSAGTLTISSQLLTVGGAFTQNGTLTTNGTSRIFFSGSGNIAGTLVDTSAMGNVEFLASRSFSNAASTTDLVITSGTLTAPALLTIAGNYTNNGTFTRGSGTVYLSGATTQTLSGTMIGTANAFNDLTILNTSGTGATQSVIFGSAASTTGTFTMVASTSAQFLAGATTTFPTLSFGGTSDATRVWLRSSSAGSPWWLVTEGSPVVSYVDVKDSYACGGSAIDATNGTNFDSTGNTCWNFPLGVPTITQFHYRWRNDDGNEAGATYAAAQDTAVTDDVFIGDRKRLRMLISNPGEGSASGITYRLEHASTTPATCTAWFAVPTTSTLSGEHWVMDLSSNVPDGAASTDSSGLSNPAGSFVAGQIKTSGNQTTAHTLTGSDTQFTEHEYAVKSTSLATIGTTYCFRLTNAGSITNFAYTVEPQIILPNKSRPSGGGGGGGGEPGGGGPPVGGGSSGGGEGGEEPGGGGPPVGGGGSGGGGDSE